MKNFNTLLTLSELKDHYGSPPVGICPLYNGKLDKTIVESKTGNPIVLPRYKAITSLNISFSPQQAGTGDPSPENIRPISGWDSVNVTNSNESESHDYNITLPETIYGGTVDAVTGEGEMTWGYLELNGTENWQTFTYASENYFLYADLGFITLSYNSGIASCFKTGGVGDKEFTTSTIQMPYPQTQATRIAWNGDVDNFKSFLSAQAAAGTPVQVAYKLATPEPFKVNPISIPSLNGINTIYSDGDNLSCDFKISSFWSDAD